MATRYESVTAGLEITAAAQVDTFAIWNTSLAYGTDGSANLPSAPLWIYAIRDVSATNTIVDPGDEIAAWAPGTITLTNIANPPPTRDLAISPSSVIAEAGEPLKFDIVPNTSGKTVTLFSYYLSVNKDAVEIQDADPITAGIQPFSIGPYYSDWQVFANRLTETATHYLLDLILFDNSGDVPDGTNVLATINAVGIGTDAGSGLRPFDVFFDADPANNRETALFNGSNKLGISLPSPALTITSAPRGSISGFVPLEGRPNNFSKEITFELRPTGSFVSVDDARFIAANDQNPEEPGIQVTTTAQGGYTLTEVPAGTYNLVALTPLYLSGQVQVTVSANEVLSNIRPTYANNGTTNRNVLFTGDANGDNKIDTADLNIVFNAFNTQTGQGNFNVNADFNGDGQINITDLSLVSGHLVGQLTTVTGVSPVFKPVQEGPNAYAEFVLANMPDYVRAGEAFTVAVSIADGRNIRGYSFEMLFNPNLVAPVAGASDVTSFLGEAATSSMLRETAPGRFAVAHIQQGRPEGVSGDGEVALLTFRALADGRPGIALDRGYVINPVDQVSGVGLTQVNGREVVATDFTLDGRVDLIDYAVLMEAMGSNRALFDLNGDGVVDVQDRSLFSAAFSGSPAVMATPAGALSLALAQDNLTPNGMAEVEVRLSDVASVRAFEFELTYDAARFEYVAAPEGEVMTSGLEVRAVEPGRLLVLNAFDAAQAVGEDALVARLLFQTQGEFDRSEPFQIARGVRVDGQHLLVPVAEVGSLRAATVPTSFALYQNHPNPFNPETLIRYDVASQTQVTLRIYNVLGQVVRTLVDEPQGAGRYTVRWDGADQRGVPVSSGVYLYQIQAGSFQDGKRLVLLK